MASAGAIASIVIAAAPNSRIRIRDVDLGDGLVENTGGEDFVRSNNFARAVDLIWAEASHYYLLGYAPTARPRDLHSIDVKMKRNGLHVRARLKRGD